MNPTTTTAPRKRQSRYGIRYLLLELLENVYEIQRLCWLYLIALPKRFDHALMADEAEDVAQKPEKLEDIEPIDPRSWLKRVWNRWFRPKGQGLIWHSKRSNVYSEPFEVPRHVHEDPNHWAKDLLWLVPALGVSAWLFYLAPVLCGCLLVGCGVLLGLLALRK